MKYKLIVLDMDGTLLNRNKEVTMENQIALKKAREKGIQVAIATGRVFSSARFYANMLGIDSPIIACNGALIKEAKSNEIIYANPIDKVDLLKSLEIFRRHQVYFHTYDENTIYVESLGFSSSIYNDWNENQSEENKIPIKKLENSYLYFKDNAIETLKIMAVDEDAEKMLQIKDELAEIYGIELNKSWYNNLEVMNKGVSKGKAIEMLSKIYGIKREEIISFGDHFNDLSMKNHSGTFVAMGNAEEDVKKEAHYITSSNDESGVAKGIEKFVLDI